MKTVSINAEVKAIITICDGKAEAQSKLLGRLKASHFSYRPCQKIFYRMLSLMKNENLIPTSTIFAEDIAIDAEAKALLKNTTQVPATVRSTDSLFNTLEKYRKVRVLHQSMAAASGQLEGESGRDIDEITEELMDGLAEARTGEEVKFSTNTNNKKNIEEILNGELSLVPTGIYSFDSINGGFPNGGVVSLAASSGGGKSTFSLQLAINQYKLGYSPCLVSFEMDENEVWQRLLSNITKIPHERFVLKTLTPAQKEKVWAAARAFKDHGQKNDCVFTVLAPEEDLKLSDLVHLVKHKKIDILYIDYMSLMKPEDSKAPMHERLSEMSRLAKKAAKIMQIPFVLLSQLNDDDKIKYSGGVNENSSLTIWWRIGEQERATREVTFHISKARNQRTFDFMMKERFDIMKFEEFSNASEDPQDKAESDKRSKLMSADI